MPREDASAQFLDSRAQSRGFLEQDLQHRIGVIARGQTTQHHTGPASFHNGRNQGDIHRADCKQPLHHMLIRLRIEVIEIRFDLRNMIGLAFCQGRLFREKHTQCIRPTFRISVAGAISDHRGFYHRGCAELRCQCAKQRHPCRRRQLTAGTVGVYRNSFCQRSHGRPRHRQESV